MHFNADLIVLDEPTAALAVEEVRKVLDFVRRIKDSGRACIYIEHNLAHVHEVADRLVILDRGRDRLARSCPKDMTVAELTEYLIDLQHRGPDDARPTPRARLVAAGRGPADHPRLRAACSACSCGPAPQVFLPPNIYTTFLSTAAAADPARGRADLRDRRRRDRPCRSRRSSPSRASSSPCSSRTTTSAGSPWSRRWPPALLVGWLNGFLIARIGIPSFIATLGTQFFWSGMATVLSGGKSYALRGAETSSVWQVIVGRPFARLRDDLDRASSRCRPSGRC